MGYDRDTKEGLMCIFGPGHQYMSVELLTYRSEVCKCLCWSSESIETCPQLTIPYNLHTVGTTASLEYHNHGVNFPHSQAHRPIPFKTFIFFGYSFCALG